MTRKVLFFIFKIIEYLINNSQNPFVGINSGKLVDRLLGFLQNVVRIGKVHHFEPSFECLKGVLRFILVELTDREVAGNYKDSVQ